MPRVSSYDQMQIFQNSMNASMLRHEILSDNFANATTPGFKRSDISFKKELQEALFRTPRIDMDASDPEHFRTLPSRDPAQIRARVFMESDTWTKNDKSNVDPEVENARLAENTLYYQTLANRVQSMVRNMKQIISQTPSI